MSEPIESVSSARRSKCMRRELSSRPSEMAVRLLVLPLLLTVRLCGGFQPRLWHGCRGAGRTGRAGPSQGRANHCHKERSSSCILNAVQTFASRTIVQAERDAAQLVERALDTHTQPQALNELVSDLPDFKAFLMSAPIRAVPLLQVFPDAFSLHPTPSIDGVLVGLAKWPHPETPKSTLDAAFADAICARILHYHDTRSSNPTDGVPVQYLVRTMSNMVELHVACAGDREICYHLDPERFGYQSRWAAWWASVDEHLRRFVESNGEQFEWHADEEGMPSTVSLTPKEVQRRAVLREQERAAQRQRQRQQREKRASIDASPTAAAEKKEGPNQRQEAAVDVDALARACISGSHHLFVLRGASRTGKLFAEELLAAASHAGVAAVDQLVNAGPALWLLDRSTATEESERLFETLPLLASVRLCGGVVAAASSSSAMLDLLRDEGKGGEALRRCAFSDSSTQPQPSSPRWSLRVERHFPSADARLLPFHTIEAVPEICFALHNALGGTFVASSTSTTSTSEDSENEDDDVAELVLLQMKDAVVLIRESLPPRTASGASRVPEWVPRWEQRGFAFSSSLDPLVAQAALNLAAFAHADRKRRLHGEEYLGAAQVLSSVRVFDPCCGSGTILAAAAALGCTDIVGSDLRSDFVDLARANLADHTAADGTQEPHLFVHDAKEPLPDAATKEGWASTLIVSNPPWGKNIGDRADGEAIVRSVTKGCEGATFCWVASSRAVRALVEMPDVRVLRRVPLGAVELVVCDARPPPAAAASADMPKASQTEDLQQPASQPARLLELGLDGWEAEEEEAEEVVRPPRVLILGDADFAYSCALASSLSARGKEAHIWTSCFESKDELLRKYPHASSAMEELASHSNNMIQSIQCGVDARSISDHFLFDGGRRSADDEPQQRRRLSFDRIVFNLPQAPIIPGARNKIQRHRALLRDLCASAEAVLTRNGQLWVALLAGQGGTALDPVQRPFGDTWQIQHAGASAGLLVRAATHVDADRLGYVPTGRRQSQRITPSGLSNGLVLHVLSREGEPEEPAACGPLEWKFHNSFRASRAVEVPKLEATKLFELAKGALEGHLMSHALVEAPELLRPEQFDMPLRAGEVLTYRFTYRSADIALSRERVQDANAAACEAIAQATGLEQTLGYPVR